MITGCSDAAITRAKCTERNGTPLGGWGCAGGGGFGGIGLGCAFSLLGRPPENYLSFLGILARNGENKSCGSLNCFYVERTRGGDRRKSIVQS